MVQKKLVYTCVLMGGLAGAACVKSNLDNVFDPQFPFGLIIALGLTQTGGSSTGSTNSPTAALCTTGPTIQEYGTPGTYTYTVPSSAQTVAILVIGGGGAGGSTGAETDGGTSSVKIQSQAVFLQATGGAHGTQLGSGATGGSGGIPNGVNGSNGLPACGVCDNRGPGGKLTNYSQGSGGYGHAANGLQGGGGGGSGGMNTSSRNDLSGQTLEIIVGAGGTYTITSASQGSEWGQPGYVRLLIY